MLITQLVNSNSNTLGRFIKGRFKKEVRDFWSFFTPSLPPPCPGLSESTRPPPSSLPQSEFRPHVFLDSQSLPVPPRSTWPVSQLVHTLTYLEKFDSLYHTLSRSVFVKWSREYSKISKNPLQNLGQSEVRQPPPPCPEMSKIGYLPLLLPLDVLFEWQEATEYSVRFGSVIR